MRRRFALILGLAAVVLAIASPALAHVTVNPDQAETGSFARFAIRVPNERDDASTVKLDVQLPPQLSSVSFETLPGWTRTQLTEEIPPAERPTPEPGEEAETTRVTQVTWEGGKIGPGEFFEFGISAHMPDQPGTLLFKAVQTYDNGEVVRWIADDESADTPSPRVTVTGVAASTTTGPAATTTSGAVTASPSPVAKTSNSNVAAIVLAIGALLVALAALTVSFLTRQARSRVRAAERGAR